MILADVALLVYGAVVGFACGCAVTAAIALWGIRMTSRGDG